MKLMAQYLLHQIQESQKFELTDLDLQGQEVLQVVHGWQQLQKKKQNSHYFSSTLSIMELHGKLMNLWEEMMQY